MRIILLKKNNCVERIEALFREDGCKHEIVQIVFTYPRFLAQNDTGKVGSNPSDSVEVFHAFLDRYHEMRILSVF